MLAYPKVKDTPNRKLRKSQRNVVFLKNRKATKLLKKQNRALRQSQAEVSE